jgi:hypothetical protein
MAPIIIKETTKLPMLGVATRARSDAATLLSGVGAKVARTDFTWKSGEPTAGAINPGVFDAHVNALTGAGILPLAILCYSNPIYTGIEKFGPTAAKGLPQYVAYCKATAAHFGTRVHYELWNEPNLSGFWPTPNPLEYGALVKATAGVMKAAAPGCVIITGGIAANNGTLTLPDGSRSTVEAEYIKKFLSVIDKSKVDYLGYHPYTGADKFYSNALMRPEGMNERMASISAAAGGLPVIGTESGFENTQCGPAGTTLAGQRLRQGILTFRWCMEVLASDGPYGIYYNLVDTGTDPLNKEHNFGLYDPNLVLKPAGRAFKTVADLRNKATGFKLVRDGDIFTATFTFTDGRRTVRWNGGALNSTVTYEGIAYPENIMPTVGPLVPFITVPTPAPVPDTTVADLKAQIASLKAELDIANSVVISADKDRLAVIAERDRLQAIVDKVKADIA